MDKKNSKQQTLQDDIFTNKQSLQYPTEDDFVDIKILNNNTKILNETKADISSLLDVAKETTPKNIENITKNVQSTANVINTNVANIKSTVETINSNVNNISSNVGSNLQQVAKERSQYSIEDKVKQIEQTVNNLKINIIDRKKWFNYPNLRAVPIAYKTINPSYTLVSSVTGSGHLLCAYFGEMFLSKNLRPNVKTEAQKVGIKIEIDGSVVFHIEFDPNDKNPFQFNSIYTYVGIIAHNDTNTWFYDTTNIKPYYTVPNSVINTDLYLKLRALPYPNDPLTVAKNLELSSSLQKITETQFLGSDNDLHVCHYLIGKIISNDDYLRFNNSLKIYIMNEKNTINPEQSLDYSSRGGRIIYSLDN